MPIGHGFQYVPISLLRLIYPLEETNRVRDTELKVLCLGVGRTGTDSLRHALEVLGITPSYHGFFMTSEGVGDTPQWERLNRAKFGAVKDPAFLNTEQFDKILGNSEAILDFPSAAFGVELLRAYPDAKVILNRRSDLEAWYQSQLQTIDKLYQDWPSWSRQWFDAETFFIVRTVHWLRSLTQFDFKRNGKQFYTDHYLELEAELKRHQRPWLDWEVEDGWEPLCEFLGKAVPALPFPSENAGAGGFDQKRMEIHRVRIARGFRNMRIAAFLALQVVGIVAYSLAK